MPNSSTGPMEFRGEACGFFISHDDVAVLHANIEILLNAVSQIVHASPEEQAAFFVLSEIAKEMIPQTPMHIQRMYTYGMCLHEILVKD